MSEATRPKRAGQHQWTWEKLYIPCPLHTKNEFARAAREHGMSQGELGLVIVEQALQRRQWLEELVREHRRTEV